MHKQLTESPPRITSPQLFAYAAEPGGGGPRALEGADRAELLRTLWRADSLTHMPKAAAVRAVRDAHTQLCTELRRPTDDEESQGMRHGLFALCTGIIPAGPNKPITSLNATFRERSSTRAEKGKGGSGEP